MTDIREDVLVYVESLAIALDALVPDAARISAERAKPKGQWHSVTVLSSVGGIQVSVDDEWIVVHEVGADGTPLGSARESLHLDRDPAAPEYPVIGAAARRLHDRLHAAQLL